MKYFIDFEAMQFSNEIISVGCVSENGEKFYSLVQPQKAEKITEFITSLTGITYEELFSAPSADKVFSEFYEWVDKTEKLLPTNLPDNFAYAKSVIEYIGCNFTENINLKDMADLVGLTSSYFSKYFKNITGTNFTQYLNSVRLEHALNEMLYKGQTVTKATMNNGFPNVKSFIEICKKSMAVHQWSTKNRKLLKNKYLFIILK